MNRYILTRLVRGVDDTTKVVSFLNSFYWLEINDVVKDLKYEVAKDWIRVNIYTARPLSEKELEGINNLFIKKDVLEKARKKCNFVLWRYGWTGGFNLWQ